MTSNHVTNQVCQVAGGCSQRAFTRHIVFWLQQLRIEPVNLLGLTIWLAHIVRFVQFAEFAQIGQFDLGVPAGLG